MGRNILVILLILPFALSGCLRERGSDSPVIVTVADKSLHESDVTRVLADSELDTTDEALRTNYVNHWIDRQLLVHEAEKRKFDRDPEIRKRLLALEEELVINRLFEDEIKVEQPDEDAIVQYWSDHNGEFTRPTGEIKAILVYAPDKSMAWKVRYGMDKANNGKELMELYPELSIDSTGWIRWSLLPSKIEQALKNLRPGDPTVPFKAEGRWMMAKLVDRAPAGSIRPVEEVREEIVVRMKAEEKVRNRIEFISHLRRQARRDGIVQMNIAESQSENIQNSEEVSVDNQVQQPSGTDTLGTEEN